MSQNFKNTAVCIVNATKYYGKKLILDNLCMNVEKGSIYGLLGASGCGKTTLLSCIVGRKLLNSGEIWTLGGLPGTPECGVPGPLVGYMPQDVALVAEFTVEGAVYYFGRIFGMTEKKIKEKFDELHLLLNLPPKDRLIKECSGGQQRRVSFAAALVNTPKLLILDEPTVGLDPLLRERIWDYLVKITQTEGVAVIITTHYIEETRQASKIGLMRNGKLMAEETPQTLLTRFKTDSLENVFLNLSQLQNDNIFTQKKTDRSNSTITLESVGSTSSLKTIQSSVTELVTSKKVENKVYASNAFSLSPYRLKALFIKNVNQIIRNPSGIAFMVIFPILEILAFFTAIGDDVKGINLAVINDEIYPGRCTNFSYDMSTVPDDVHGCLLNQMSCRFLKELEDPMFNFISYDNVEDATEGIKNGKVVGALYISSNFSHSLQDRITFLNNIPSHVLKASQIQCWLDMSNRQIGAAVQYKLVRKIGDIVESIFKDCNYTVKSAQIPINFKDPVYAHYDETFTIFMVPGVLITIMFFMGTMNTSAIIVTDRLEGVWDRSIVAGVSSLEILLTHLITQFGLIVLQTCLSLILTFGIYQIEFVGNFGTIAALVLSQGAVGMAFGFLISVISNSHSMANIIVTGSFYPMIVTCGLIWPIEGMPVVLRWISKCFPCAIPIDALRNVIKKGWGLSNLHVIDGLGMSIVWILIFSCFSIWGIKKKQ